MGGHLRCPISARRSHLGAADWSLKGARGMIGICVGQSPARKTQWRERREGPQGPGKVSVVPGGFWGSPEGLGLPSTVRGHEVTINPP